MRDKYGNTIYRKKTKTRIGYKLKLRSERKPRHLGHLDKHGIFHLSKNPDFHYFRNIEGYGFNYSLITDILGEKTPISFKLKNDRTRYILRPNRIRTNRIIDLKFSGIGFELQTFVRWDSIKGMEYCFTKEYIVTGEDGGSYVDQEKYNIDHKTIEEEEEEEESKEEELDWFSLAKEV